MTVLTQKCPNHNKLIANQRPNTRIIPHPILRKLKLKFRPPRAKYNALLAAIYQPYRELQANKRREANKAATELILYYRRCNTMQIKHSTQPIINNSKTSPGNSSGTNNMQPLSGGGKTNRNINATNHVSNLNPIQDGVYIDLTNVPDQHEQTINYIITATPPYNAAGREWLTDEQMYKCMHTLKRATSYPIVTIYPMNINHLREALSLGDNSMTASIVNMMNGNESAIKWLAFSDTMHWRVIMFFPREKEIIAYDPYGSDSFSPDILNILANL